MLPSLRCGPHSYTHTHTLTHAKPCACAHRRAVKGHPRHRPVNGSTTLPSGGASGPRHPRSARLRGGTASPRGRGARARRRPPAANPMIGQAASQAAHCEHQRRPRLLLAQCHRNSRVANTSPASFARELGNHTTLRQSATFCRHGGKGGQGRPRCRSEASHMIQRASASGHEGDCPGASQPIARRGESTPEALILVPRGTGDIANPQRRRRNAQHRHVVRACRWDSALLLPRPRARRN